MKVSKKFNQQDEMQSAIKMLNEMAGQIGSKSMLVARSKANITASEFEEKTDKVKKNKTNH